MEMTVEQENLKIYQTKGYDNFEFMVENRGLHPKHVENLKQSMLANGFSSDGAIVVYKDGNKLKIVDGQHRYKAAMLADIPVKYTIIDAKKWQQKVIEKNTYSKAWKLHDYLNYFKSIGLGPYLILDNFFNHYKISLSTAINILGGGAAITGGSTHGKSGLNRSAFKDGTYGLDKVYYDRAVVVMDQINKIRHFSERYIKFAHEGNFVNACYKIVTHPRYKEERMMAHLEQLSVKIVRCVDCDAYTGLLGEIYNYKKRRNSKVDFFDRSELEVGDENEVEESIYDADRM